MQQKDLLISYFELDSADELSADDHQLLNMAADALKSAYVPYSHYKVGSAVMLENGVIITGSNQENMAFPSGLCAERVALFSAASQHPGITIRSIAITAQSKDFPVNEPVSPCGACRQAMIEYETNQGKPIKLILGCETGKTILITKVGDLLPLSFKEDKLKKKL
jgi:cytidine deaminase